MILTQQLLYKLDLRLNNKASNQHQMIPLEDKILALNEAQIKLIKKKLNSNNIYNAGFEGFKKRYEDLQVLVVDFEELTPTKVEGAYEHYKASIGALTQKYMFPLEMYSLCTKGKCKDRVVHITQPVIHGDLSSYIDNPHYAPSFEYQETFSTISGNDILVYTDKTFTVDKLFVTYLRYPRKIDFAGYIDFDGTASTTQDCELADYLEDELLDLAVMELAMETENIPAVQFTDIRNKNNE